MFDWWERKKKMAAIKPCPIHAFNEVFLFHGATWCPRCRKFSDSPDYKKRTDDDGA